MKRFDTPLFSIEANPYFESVRYFAGSIGLRRQPETLFSPAMSVWTTPAKHSTSLKESLADLLKDNGPIAGCESITHSGMQGALATVVDQLADEETGQHHPWYRMRALLASPDGKTWFHATALCNDEDLEMIKTDFSRMLDSIQIKADEEEAGAAHVADEEQVDAVLQQLKKRMDEVRQAAPTTSLPPATTAGPGGDVETCFDEALASAGLSDQRQRLRSLMEPCLSLTEAGEAVAGQTGLSRIGGAPDLPKDLPWPRDGSGFHLNFLAQVDLAALPGRPEKLPSKGLLSFFTGSDYTEWKVLAIPNDAELIAQSLPPDAEDTAILASRMVAWSQEQQRFVISLSELDGLSVDLDDQGLLSFRREGQPLRVLASEYEISRSSQVLRILSSLNAPDEMPLEDDADDKQVLHSFQEAIDAAFRVGDGPQHQMFGTAGAQSLATMQARAAAYAQRQGWTDIANAEDWFILLKLASGGAADFDFSDHGDYFFLIHRQDAEQGDFSRVYAFVASS